MQCTLRPTKHIQIWEYFNKFSTVSAKIDHNIMSIVWTTLVTINETESKYSNGILTPIIEYLIAGHHVCFWQTRRAVGWSVQVWNQWLSEICFIVHAVDVDHRTWKNLNGRQTPTIRHNYCWGSTEWKTYLSLALRFPSSGIHLRTQVAAIVSFEARADSHSILPLHARTTRAYRRGLRPTSNIPHCCLFGRTTIRRVLSATIGVCSCLAVARKQQVPTYVVRSVKRLFTWKSAAERHGLLLLLLSRANNNDTRAHGQR